MISGQFPVNPLTIRYINEQLTAEGHRPDGTVQPLTVLDLEELEGCQALLQRKGRTLPQLLDAWRHSPYRDAAFRNYLAHEIGGQELGRPDDVRAALTESFQVIQQLLGTPGAWTPRKAPRQDVPRNRPGNPAQHRPGYEQIPAADRPARQEAALGTWLALRLG